jgi:hypothetical protein
MAAVFNELETKRNRKYYQTVRVNGEDFSIGDSVKSNDFLSSGGPKFGMIERIFSDLKSQKFCKIRWFYSRYDIGEETFKQYLFRSSTTEMELLFTLHTEVLSIQQLLNFEKIDLLILCKEENEKMQQSVHFIRSIFDQSTNLFYPIAPSSLNLPSVKKNKKILRKLCDFFPDGTNYQPDNLNSSSSSSTEKTLLISELMRYHTTFI